MTVARTRTFRSGNSEAVRLPKDVAFGEDVELVIVRSGDVLTLYPATTSIPEMIARLNDASQRERIKKDMADSAAITWENQWYGAGGGGTTRAPSPWWQVNLGRKRIIDRIRLWNVDVAESSRAADFYVLVSDIPFTPADLAVQCGRPLLLRQPFAPSAFDEVILGCANQLADEMNVARVEPVPDTAIDLVQHDGLIVERPAL